MTESKINNLLLFLENRLSLTVSSAIVGLFFLLLAMLYTSPEFTAHIHGSGFSEMSKNPLDFDANFSLQYRILGPLIGYLFFLRGKLFVLVPLIFSVLFLAAVYFVYRKKNYLPVEALLMTSFIAFSCTILIPLVSPGYTDTISYFFIFLAFNSRRLIFSAFCFLMAVFNHESNIVLFFPLIFFHCPEPDISEMKRKTNISALKIVFIFILILVPYFAFRYWIAANVNVEFSPRFYFSENNVKICLSAWQWVPAGFFYAFKLFWFFPLYMIWISIKTGNKLTALFLASIIIFTMMLLIISYDISRMICLAFPAILFSAEKIRSYWGSEKFISFSKKLLVFNLLILPYFISKEGFNPIFPFLIQKVFHLKEFILN